MTTDSRLFSRYSDRNINDKNKYVFRMIILQTISASLVLWVLFIVFATAKRKRSENMFFEAVFAIIAVPFAVIDSLLNIVYGSIIFLQFPHYKRLTLTARLIYILSEKNGWRYKLASFICKRMIEPWEQGHCALDK